MKKEYIKPEIEVTKLTPESIAAGGTVGASGIQTAIRSLSFSSNVVENY